MGAPLSARASLVRLRTRMSRPLGSDTFVNKLESALGQRLSALPVGRPRKGKGETVRCYTRRQ